MNRFFHLGLAFSQLLNVLIGSGYADESLSAFSHRTNGPLRPIINALFFWQEDHCRDAFYAEKGMKQLPPEYRKN